MYVTHAPFFIGDKSVIWGTNKVQKQEFTHEQLELNHQVASYALKIETFLTQINRIILDRGFKSQVRHICS